MSLSETSSTSSRQVNEVLQRKTLLETRARDLVNAAGKTLLVTALLRKDSDGVKRLLQVENVDPNERISTGETPLYVAAFVGYSQGVKTLLDHGASSDVPNKDGQTPIFAAAAKGHYYCLNLLLENASANPNMVAPLGDDDVASKQVMGEVMTVEWYSRMKLFRGETALFWAIQTGHEGCAKLLLQYDADVHLTTGDWECPLYMAASTCQDRFLEMLLENANPRAALKIALRLRNVKMMELIFTSFSFPPPAASRDELMQALIDKNLPEVRRILASRENHQCHNQTISTGETPLYVTTTVGFEEGILCLLEKGVDLDEQNNDKEPPTGKQFGETPLHGAAGNGHAACLRSLLTFGADPNKVADIGLSIVDPTDSESYQYVTPERFAKAQFFLGETPLFWAVVNGNEECVRLLLENPGNRADPNLTVGNWYSALYVAASRSNGSSILQLLLSHGANPDGADLLGEGYDMPLYVAAREGIAENVRILLQAGADPDLPNRNSRTTDAGDTPLLAAVKNGHLTCIELLLQNQANPGEAFKTALFLCAKEPVDLILTKGRGRVKVGQFFEDDDNVRKLLAQEESAPLLIFLLAREQCDIPWEAKQRILELARDDRTTDEAVFLEYLHATLKDLNERSIQHHTVFLLMFDFYMYCIWIGTFAAAAFHGASSNRWHSQGSGKDDDEDGDLGKAIIVALLVATAIFLVREVFEWLRGGRRYVTDFWNWVDLTAIGLVLTIAIKVLTGNFSIASAHNDNSQTYDGIVVNERFQGIVMSAAFFMCLSFLGYLRATLLPFSDFVGGVIQILFDLFPFGIVASVVLVTLSFMYWIQDYDPEDADVSFLTALYGVFGLFLGGFEEDSVDGPLDLLFGIVMVMVLLNVLIAIVTTSWTNAVKTSIKMLCRHRFELLEQVDSLHLPSNYFVDFIHRPYDDDYEAFVEERVFSKARLSLLGRETEKLDDGQKENYLRLLTWSVGYVPLRLMSIVLPWLLGMISFGLWWPKHIRQTLFGMIRETDRRVVAGSTRDESAISLESRIVRMENDLKQVKDDMAQQAQQMTQALKKLDRLLESQAKANNNNVGGRTISEGLPSLRPSIRE